jgi:hypothetical protein
MFVDTSKIELNSLQLKDKILSEKIQSSASTETESPT